MTFRTPVGCSTTELQTDGSLLGFITWFKSEKLFVVVQSGVTQLLEKPFMGIGHTVLKDLGISRMNNFQSDEGGQKPPNI